MKKKHCRNCLTMGMKQKFLTINTCLATIKIGNSNKPFVISRGKKVEASPYRGKPRDLVKKLKATEKSAKESAQK